MQVLVWPDVHNRIILLRKFLEKNGENFQKRIFLGDWFDAWDDKAEDAKATAEYLAELMEDPRNIFIEGNHDSSYKYGRTSTFCSGFTFEKQRAIASVMTPDHWAKFKLFHFEGNVLCSHAGVHPAIFMHPIAGIDPIQMEKDCEQAMQAARCNIRHPIYEAGMSSGGRATFGGINWLRWWEFKPIEGINQIVGHTIHSEPQVTYLKKKVETKAGHDRVRFETARTNLTNYRNMPPKKEPCSINWNIDTDNRNFAIIEDGKIHIKLTLDYL